MELKAIDTVYNGYRFRSLNFPVPPRKKMSARSNLAGRRFGRCVAVECLGVTETGGLRWWGCVCDCGTRFAARSRELLEGDTRPCGCLQREKAALQGGHNKLPAGHAARNEFLAFYKKSAKLRDIEWGLEDETFFTLVSSPCTYCHTPPDSLRKPNKGVNGGLMYSGIDRADNRLGYLPGNVVPCCWNCTRAKGTLPLGEFTAWLDRVAEARQARFEHASLGLRARGRTVAKKDLAAENADLREVLLRIARKAASRSKVPIPANKTLGEIEAVALNALETV